MKRVSTLALIVVVLGLGACAEEEPGPLEDAQTPPVVEDEPIGGATLDVFAEEYKFGGLPPVLERGETTFRLNNEGKEPHEFSLVLITGDQAVEELIQLPGDQASEFIEDKGHAEAKPGGTAEVEVDLTPGRYGYVCFVTAPDGEPHALKGMHGEFTIL